MRHPFLAGLAIAGGLHLAAPSASAQAPDSLPAPRDSLQATGDLGFVNTAGNTSVTTINAGERLRWRRGRLALGQMFAMVYGRSEGQTTSALWRAEIRGDYALSQAVAAYTLVGYDRNRFAGIARRFEEGAGLALGLVRHRRDRLEAEVGLSLIQQGSTTGLKDDFASARGAVTFEHHFAPETYLRQVVETTANLEAATDYRVTSESALVAPISQRISLKISYVIRFDHLPEPGFRSTDRLLTSGIQVTL